MIEGYNVFEEVPEELEILLGPLSERKDQPTVSVPDPSEFVVSNVVVKFIGSFPHSTRRRE